MTRELIEAAPVADAERVKVVAREAIKATHKGSGTHSKKYECDPSQVLIEVVADAIRPYITPAPVADTVAVPVASLKQWLKRINLMPFRNELQPTIAEITALLPPPPAPEPSAELQKQWDKEAMAMFPIRFGENNDLRREGYVARARAAWEKSKKGGG